ncbi:MAG TPA: hypothetical protein VFS67_36415 [Polyangiaceae bacterium]|nr:hypothetical protein [Polyangiaceae bacterium]
MSLGAAFSRLRLHRSSLPGAFLISLTGAVALRPGEARACSCVLPFANELRVGDGRIPSNAAGVPWWYGGYSKQEPSTALTLERWQGQQLERVDAVIEPVDGILLIRPAQPWAEGERYRISIDAGPMVFAEERFRTAEFEVTQPLEAGELTLVPASEPIRQPLALGYFIASACTVQADAVLVNVSASWTTNDFPLGILYFETYVDGQRWLPREGLCTVVEPGSSWVGRGRDRIVADCSGYREAGLSLAPGTHQVRMEARLPGTDVVFSSDELSLGLFCEDERESGSLLNAGGPFAVAPVPDDGKQAEAAAPQRSSASGCALTSPAPAAARPAAALLLALASLGLLRRRAERVVQRAHPGVGR